MMLIAVLAAMTLTGCGPIKMPRMPVPVQDPTTDIASVNLVDASEKAGKYDITITLVNPNNFELPMTFATYSLTVGERTYEGSAIPNTTLPALSQIQFTVPAVLEGPAAAGQNFTAEGTITLNPPGQIRQLIYELGIPMPTAHFDGQGTVQSTLTPTAKP
ncbi:MAG: hypothetical protein GC162_16495 [Planctomycetes bacterium]|nr:hypothetical protein [Planctomycetota bacterium]